MYRATTPTYIFKLPFSTNLVKTVQITYQQFSKTVFQKTETDCMMTDTEIKLTLTQEETLLFSHTCRAEVQLRVVTTEGQVLASKIFEVKPKACLDEEVLPL